MIKANSPICAKLAPLWIATLRGCPASTAPDVETADLIKMVMS